MMHIHVGLFWFLLIMTLIGVCATAYYLAYISARLIEKFQDWLTTRRDRVPDTEILATAIRDLTARVNALEADQDTEAIETLSGAILDVRKAVGSLTNRMKRLERDVIRLDESMNAEEAEPVDVAESEYDSLSV